MTDRLAELLSRKLSAEITPEELRELYDYFQGNPGDQYYAELLSSYWNAPHEITNQPASENDKHFEHILRLAEQASVPDVPDIDENFDTPPKINRWKNHTRWLIAVALLGIIVSGFFLFFKPQSQATISSTAVEKNEIIAKPGARSHLLLPDGSQVWLNSDSKLSYSNFNDTLREVELDGEAFFDVVKEKSRPFIVHTSGIAIHVLGTAFNVKSYAGESVIEATLIRGLIEVEKNDNPNAPKVILHPHQKLVFNKRENSMVKSSGAVNAIHTEKLPQHEGFSVIPLPKNIADSSLKETSWVYNRLLFDGDSFLELSSKMERWFNVKILLKNETLANQRLHGSFENETIDEALQVLKLTTPFKYKINGNEIEIDKN